MCTVLEFHLLRERGCNMHFPLPFLLALFKEIAL